MREPLKGFVERSALKAFRAIGGPGVRGRRIILAYHNVVPDDEPSRGDRALHQPLARFLGHVELLQRHCDVLPLEALLADDGDPERPRVAITFDDAYRGAVTLGIAALQARGLPATVFVAPRYLDDGDFWWDRWLDAQEDVQAFRRAALGAASGDEDAVDLLGRRTGRHAWAPGPWHRCVREDELAIAVARGGLSVGSHTWHHRNLGVLWHTALEETLHSAREWTRRFGDAATDVLCLPYGIGGVEVEAVARALGHPYALRVNGGALPTRRPLPFLLPRLSVPAGLSDDGLALRLRAYASPDASLA